MKKLLAIGILFGSLGASGPIYAAMHMLREEDADKQIEAQMAPDWRECTASDECGLLTYGCSGVIASNKTHISEATDLAHKMGGNPAEIKCAPHPQPIYRAACFKNLCFATE